MKMGSFLIGGLAGAAVVMMMQRNKRIAAMAGNMGQGFRNRMGSMKEDAIGRMLNMRFGDKDRSSAREASDAESREDRSHSSSGGGLDTIAHLAAQDSGVQRQVNEILEQSGQHRI